MAGLDYARTSSSGGEGFRYETKVTALIALRLYNETRKFYLASNMMMGGKFDDVVYSAQIGDSWETNFIQLKHRQSTSLCKKKITLADLQYKSKDFNIPKYYESFKTFDRKFRTENNDPMFNKGFNCSKFIVYTNAVFHDEVSNGQSIINSKILNTSEIRDVNLQFHPTSYVFNSIRENGFEIFADKLMFFSAQANENDIDKIIMTEIKTGLADKKFEQAALKFILHEWIDFIQKRLGSSDITGRYLVHAEVKGVLKRLAGEAEFGKKHDVSIKFLDAFLKSVHEQLGSEKLIYLTSFVDTTVMCLAALKQMGLTQEPNIIITLQNVIEYRPLITRKWFNATDLTLVVDCEVDTLNVDLECVSKFLLHLKQMNDSNRIILIATANNVPAKNLSLSINAKKKKFNCSLKNLCDDSKKMLKERDVYFQGYKIQLESVMPNNRALDDVFDLSAITQLVHGRQLNVGIKPVDQKSYYVTRVLIRQATVHPDTLYSADFNSSFAVSGISHDDTISYFNNFEVASFYDIISQPDIKLTKSVIHLSELNPEKEFETLVKSVQTPLHWFEKSRRGWQWKRSTGNIDEVISNVTNQYDFVATDNIMKIKDKIVVVVAEPGMGKSTLLEHLAAETKKQCPHMWVIMLTLSDHTSVFSSSDFMQKTAEHTKNLLSVAAGIDINTSKFNERLFNQCYETGNLIVLLDGFDEITPQFTQQGLAMMNVLRQSAVSRIWVSARPVVMDILENITITISYSIKPFSEKDQTTFLKKYWKSQIPLIEMEKLNVFVEKLLLLLSKSFDNKLHQFTGIPLQTLMIAEIFQENLNDYHNSGRLCLKEKLNGLELFSEFVKIKQRSYFNKSKIGNALSYSDLKLLEEIREKELMSMALLTLLPMSTCEGLEPRLSEAERERLKAKVLEGSEKIGIVLSFKKDCPQFIHRTFAEYFVALFLSKNYATNRKFLFSDTFFSKAFEFVKYFFDRILCVGKCLHEAVLDNDLDKVKELLKNSESLINEVDLGGRTALHLAAAQPSSEKMIVTLLEDGCDVDMEDAVLKWCPLQYAVQMVSLENIAPLLERGDKSLPPRLIPITWETLLLTVSGDYLKLFLYLLENGLYDEECLDVLSTQNWLGDYISEGLTILHLAAFYNARKILKYLLRKDTRDSRFMLIESLDENGMTPLILAASKGSFASVNVLLSAGANSLAIDNLGANLCQYATEAQDLQLLCEALADATVRKADPQVFLAGAFTVLVADCSDWGEHSLALLLSLYPALATVNTTKGMSPIVWAAIKGNNMAIRTLKTFGADINELSSHGAPIHLATTGGHEDVVKELLTYPDTIVDKLDPNGHTALYIATSKGKQKIYEMLVGAGANVHFCSADNFNLAHAVADPLSRHRGIFLDLVSRQVDFKKVNNFGETGLSLLQQGEVFDLLSVLDPTVVSPKRPESKAKNNEKKKKKKNNKAPNVTTYKSVDQSDVEKFLNDLKTNDSSGDNKDELIAKIQSLVLSAIQKKENNARSSSSNSVEDNQQKRGLSKKNAPQNAYVRNISADSSSAIPLEGNTIPAPLFASHNNWNANLMNNRNRPLGGIFNKNGRNQIQNYRANYGQNQRPNVSQQLNQNAQRNNNLQRSNFGNNQSNNRHNNRASSPNPNGQISEPRQNCRPPNGPNQRSNQGKNQNHSGPKNNRPNNIRPMFNPGQNQNPHLNPGPNQMPHFNPGPNQSPLFNPGPRPHQNPNFNYGQNQNYGPNPGPGQMHHFNNGPHQNPRFNNGQNQNYGPNPGPSQMNHFNYGPHQNPNFNNGPHQNYGPNPGPSRKQQFNPGQNTNQNSGQGQNYRHNSGQNPNNRPNHGQNSHRPNSGPNQNNHPNAGNNKNNSGPRQNNGPDSGNSKNNSGPKQNNRSGPNPNSRPKR